MARNKKAKINDRKAEKRAPRVRTMPKSQQVPTGESAPMIIKISLHENLTVKQLGILRTKKTNMMFEGCAGTGKTYIALAKALQLVEAKEVEKIIIIRSAVETRSIGFLPGDHAEKMDVYAAPYVGLFKKLVPKLGYKAFVDKKVLEFHPTSFLRGCTFENAVIILDEFQNLNEHEFETVVTRVGEGSRLYVCGDTAQSDLKYNEKREHEKVLAILKTMPDFHHVFFTADDIVRSGFVKDYFMAKEKMEQDIPLPTKLLG